MKPAVKDREETKKRIVESVGRVLAEDGFRKLGVNRIAKQAGVDKVLIYRYFGGLSELVTEYGESIEYWPHPDELVDDIEVEGCTLGAAKSLQRFFRNYVRAIRQRPATLEIMVWELNVHDEMVSRLEDVRLKTALECFERMGLDTGDECDLTAAVLMIFAAVNSLLIKSRLAGTVGGLDLKDDAAWQRIDVTVGSMLRGIMAGNGDL